MVILILRREEVLISRVKQAVVVEVELDLVNQVQWAAMEAPVDWAPLA